MQLKWAGELVPGLDAGFIAALATSASRPRGATTTTLVVPLTWQATDAVRVHLNLGRDLPEGQAGTAHAGISLEAAASAAWSFVGERFREGGASLWRAGARWTASPKVDVDLSRAQGRQGVAPAWWTVGVTWTF